MIFVAAITLLCVSATKWGQASPTAQIPALNWTERSDWVNVKTDVTPAAVGNEIVDDTAALQAAFDQVGDGATLYLPPGTYRITKTLALIGPRHGVLVVGHGCDTKLVWDGEEGGKLFMDNGVAYSRYVGLVFDGQGKGAVGFHHFSDRRFETEVRHQHMAFLNFTDAGVLADPSDKFALAETNFENCLFENCRRGVAFTQFNDYDYTFEGCEFRQCETGIECRHGNFYARNCHFEGSRVVDILSAPEHGCSVRRCTSVGSAQFLRFGNSVSPMTIQDCHVSGWTGNRGAILLSGAPVILFDCAFTNPPDKNTPVGILRDGQRLIVSENRTEGTDNVLPTAHFRDVHKTRVYEIPSGKRKGAMLSAQQRFLQDKVEMPPKIFDAKENFGARGDGKTDDTAALQKAIDAARQYGKGALTYLPTGHYVITDTLRVTGKDYVIGGSGWMTRLHWRGAEGGTMMSIHDPQNVTLENLTVGSHDAGSMGNGIDIEQTGSDKPSHITYDWVFVFGMYQKQPFRKGLHLKGLGDKAVVLMRYVQGNLRIIDSARATILGNTTFEGSVVVEGKDKRRTGLLGFMTRLSTIVTHGLYLRDNHSIVMSDFYVEQSENGFVFEGSNDDPPGRATIQGAKVHFTVPKDAPEKGAAMTINNYGGQIFLGHHQFYVEPEAVRINHVGSQPLDLFIIGSCFYRTYVDVTKDDALKVYLLGNETVGKQERIAEDTMDTKQLEQIAPAFDDLRRLGEVDLKLNYGLTQQRW